MDPATLIGVLLAFGVIIANNVLEGGSPTSLLLFPPMLLVFGATFAVTMAGGTMADLKSSMKALRRAFAGRAAGAADLVPSVVSLADKARREGLLALEEELEKIDDPFLVRGVTLAIDGTDPEDVRDLLEAEVHAKRLEDKRAAKFYADAGSYAPTIGIVGTVMGLVHVLENLANPEELGELIAAAFLATLWGVASANVLWLPIASRLKRLSEVEIARMELAIEGVAALQAGSNPRIIAQKLTALLPAEQREQEAA